MATSSFLLIDAGNTRLKWATANRHGPIRVRGDIVTREVTASWVASLARKFSRQQVVLASVVPKLVPAFRRAFARRLHVVTGTSPALGLRFDYPKPSEIGADRLAAAVTAQAERKGATIIVSCGTATAFTVLDREGRLCGGVIAPGLQAQLDALLDATAQLPATKLHAMRRYLARSTQDAIRAGAILSFQGGVKEIVARLSEALPRDNAPRILLTGGNASYVKHILGVHAALRPLLVFEGLRMIGNRAFIDTL